MKRDKPPGPEVTDLNCLLAQAYRYILGAAWGKPKENKITVDAVLAGSASTANSDREAAYATIPESL